MTKYRHGIFHLVLMATLCLALTIGTGCMSTSYRINPDLISPDNAHEYDNVLLREVHVYRGGTVDAAASHAAEQAFTKRSISNRNKESTHYVDIILHIPVGGKTFNRFAAVAAMLTCSIYPIYCSDSYRYRGDMSVYDASGALIIKESMQPYIVEYKSYFSVIFPTGLIAFLEPTPYKAWTSVNNIYDAERLVYISGNEEPIIVRIIATELKRLDSIVAATLDVRSTPNRDASPSDIPTEQEKKLRELKRLYDEKLIDREEYENTRRRIIEQVVPVDG